MPQIVSSQPKPKILEYLKKVAPFSVIDLGIRYANEGRVVESGRLGTRIFGVVREQDESTHSVNLDVLSSNNILATCTCSKPEEMAEQWCYHAASVLWKAGELDFFQQDNGFPQSESTRGPVSSPQEISRIIEELKNLAPEPTGRTSLPLVKIRLETSSDRLGVQILFDDVPQGPAIFAGVLDTSSRALDSLLIQLLDERGHWDEEEELWFINGSADIEMILGLVTEYEHVVSFDSGRRLTISSVSVNARVQIEWTKSGADLCMRWLLPDGMEIPREGEIFGTRPFWTVIDHIIYRLSTSASKVASIFPTHIYPSPGTLSLSRSQIGGLLEALRDGAENVPYIEIKRPELQPEAEIHPPLPTFDLSLRNFRGDQAASPGQIEVAGVLDFEYPIPPTDQNVVYLPDREREAECIASLQQLGFTHVPDRRMFTISGDAALDFIHAETESLPHDWKITGLSTLKKSLKFSELSVNLSLASSTQNEGSSSWFDCQVSLTQNNANVPLSSLFKNLRADSDKWICLDSGAFALVPAGGLSMLKTTLGMLDPNFRLSNSIKVRLSTAQALGLSGIDDDRFRVSYDSQLKGLRARLSEFQEVKRIPISKKFLGKLRSYQEDGVNWLSFLYDFELGGILADEMGLGKTVQTLAFLQTLRDQLVKEKGKILPTLIIAPTSVITNWAYESKRFTPDLKLLLLQGPERKQMFASIPEADVVITSYALLRIDRAELSRYQFGYLILDEAQNIKNPQTSTAKSAKAISAKRRLSLTGTPTENRPMELWSIMDFLLPGYLGSYEFFKNSIERPILEGGPGVQVARFLNAKTRPFILRRTKDEVEKDLPPKIESVVPVEMTSSQRDLYVQILEEVRPKVFDAIQKKGVQGASVSILAALLRLRQVCNHPNSISALSDLKGYDSGKFQLFQELLSEALDSGRKILVFSQFRDMLRIMRDWIEDQDIPYLYLDGTIKNRQPLIDQFNSDEGIRLFLVSLKAGGTGLNLHAADTVIIYDPWWNPAVENQAVDRAHRIGQTKKVNVYRLVTENSVEQKIMDMKARKAKVVDALINENGLSTLKLSKTDLESLFSMPVMPAPE